MNFFLATLILIGVTLFPGLELRFSIPLGLFAGNLQLPFFGQVMGFGLPIWYVLVLCFVTNFLIALLLYPILTFFVHRFLFRWKWFARFYHRRVEKMQKRVNPYIDRWGWIGLALFIAIPFPGSGVYTGGLVAYALGLKYKHFLIASLIGILIAGTLVTALTLGLLSVA